MGIWHLLSVSTANRGLYFLREMRAPLAYEESSVRKWRAEIKETGRLAVDNILGNRVHMKLLGWAELGTQCTCAERDFSQTSKKVF